MKEESYEMTLTEMVEKNYARNSMSNVHSLFLDPFRIKPRLLNSEGANPDNDAKYEYVVYGPSVEKNGAEVNCTTAEIFVAPEYAGAYEVRKALNMAYNTGYLKGYEVGGLMGIEMGIEAANVITNKKIKEVENNLHGLVADTKTNLGSNDPSTPLRGRGI